MRYINKECVMMMRLNDSMNALIVSWYKSFSKLMSKAKMNPINKFKKLLYCLHFCSAPRASSTLSRFSLRYHSIPHLSFVFDQSAQESSYEWNPNTLLVLRLLYSSLRVFGQTSQTWELILPSNR